MHRHKYLRLWSPRLVERFRSWHIKGRHRDIVLHQLKCCNDTLEDVAGPGLGECQIWFVVWRHETWDMGSGYDSGDYSLFLGRDTSEYYDSHKINHSKITFRFRLWSYLFFQDVQNILVMGYAPAIWHQSSHLVLTSSAGIRLGHDLSGVRAGGRGARTNKG